MLEQGTDPVIRFFSERSNDVVVLFLIFLGHFEAVVRMLDCIQFALVLPLDDLLDQFIIGQLVQGTLDEKLWDPDAL